MSKGLRVLALVTDAHGGFGGIAQYTRDVLEALCGYDGVAEVHVVPRLAALPLGPLPQKLHYHLDGLGGLARYAAAAMHRALALGRIDLIWCGHLNLVPPAIVIGTLLGAPVVAAAYGIEAWRPRRRLPRVLRDRVALTVAISAVTRTRFLQWSSFPSDRTVVVPNAIHLGDYGAAGKNPLLLQRYGLEGRTVLMTLGRMARSESYKGFDTVIEALPRLRADISNIAYLAVGDGDDRPRLEALAAARGVADRVVFAGRVADALKADHYRLADAYVMPSTGEGFGFVVLEALACGVPVAASRADGTREAVRDGELGILVDPADAESVHAGILQALKQPRGVPPGLAYFSEDRFAERLRDALRRVCAI